MQKKLFSKKICAVFVIISCSIFVTGLGIIVCDRDFSDTCDHPIITLVSPIFFYLPNKEVIFLTSIPGSKNAFSGNSLPLVIRAPPPWIKEV